MNTSFVSASRVHSGLNFLFLVKWNDFDAQLQLIFDEVQNFYFKKWRKSMMIIHAVFLKNKQMNPLRCHIFIGT